MRKRPSIGFSLFALSAIVVFISLGLWQIKRMDWKERRIASIQERAAASPLSLDAALTNPAEADGRRGTIAGRFRYDLTLFKIAPPVNRAAGYYMLTPLEVSPKRYILVNRGWIPLTSKDVENQTAGSTRVTGSFRYPAKPSTFALLVGPENSPTTNRWHWFDLPAMAQATHLNDQLIDSLIFEVQGMPTPLLPNNHLQYAITWFALALAVGISFIVYSFKGG